MRSFHGLLRVPLGALSLVLAACAQTTPVASVTASDAQSPPGPESPGFSQFTDVPVPDSAEMDLDRTLLLGGQEAWIGRLVLSTPVSPAELFDFYHAELPKFGWTEITVVRSDVSILTYTRLDRVATVQIKPGRFRGSEVSLTVSPRGAMPASSSGGQPSP